MNKKIVSIWNHPSGVAPLGTACSLVAAFVLALIFLSAPPAVPQVAIAPEIPGASSPDSRPSVTMVTLDPSLRQYEALWRDEIARRFPNGVGLLVHGGDFVRGQWIVGSDPSHEHVELTTDVVKRVQALYPGRTIVLLACNTGSLRLGIPGVYYATSSVWCIPDRALTPGMFASDEAGVTLNGEQAEQSRWAAEPAYVGNIFEFVRD